MSYACSRLTSVASWGTLAAAAAIGNNGGGARGCRDCSFGTPRLAMAKLVACQCAGLSVLSLLGLACRVDDYVGSEHARGSSSH